jgi:iron(III) transport system ATP-binding protein
MTTATLELVTPTIRTQPLAGEPAVRLRDLHFAYGRGAPAIDGVSLELRAGQVHALLGDSGSGKSTLLRLIAGLERPARGTIQIGEAVVADGRRRCVPPEKRRLGMVFQDFALFPHLTVSRNVQFGMPGRSPGRRRAEAEALLERVGMAGFGRAMPHTLSGGQQQRVALARALGRDPQVMLLDEPFSGLDASLRDRVRADTLAILCRAGVAVLMVTHDPREALLSAQTMSIMRAGRFTATGRPADLCRQRRIDQNAGAGRVCFECIELIETPDPDCPADCARRPG